MKMNGAKPLSKPMPIDSLIWTLGWSLLNQPLFWISLLRLNTQNENDSSMAFAETVKILLRGITMYSDNLL